MTLQGCDDGNDWADGDGDVDGDGDSDGDTDTDVDGDGDTDVDSDGDTDTDVDGDGDTDTDVDGDGDSDADGDPVEGFVVDHTTLNIDAIPQDALDRGRSLDVFWGHQSVGWNIIDELGNLGGENWDRYGLTMEEEVGADWFGWESGLGHFGVGDNWDPERKIRDFEDRVSNWGYGDAVDVAMMKFCFVDFDDGLTAPSEVFRQYRAAMERLESSYPGVTFVWWTAPIMTDGSARRDEFNGLVRDHCRTTGRVLLDIADIESHDPSGNPVRNSGHEAMHPPYSDDGGHIYGQGARRVAQGFWVLLARLAGWGG